MVSRKIDELMWRALTDCEFRNGMLNGRRQEMTEVLNLTEIEQEIVMSVHADSLAAFALGLCQRGLSPVG